MRVRYMNNIKHGLLWIACLLGVEAVAQGFSPAAMEQMKRNRLWAASWNAAVWRWIAAIIILMLRLVIS